ncbi:DNA-binding CsgD family transcriptional regulator [Streptomyces sp. 3330]|uniref:helix-turn-helix transcriptional regulator n=1 Tax=Streptomyces sp. 3330 TaxID=2817755 RepID=UPI00285AD749|nr:AAA family ATPase [Streptomyces sp. 3330]MDR6975132.1 DNA-binding CsgD family transcriptional regulator [Streptomyces sp. 3330]
MGVLKCGPVVGRDGEIREVAGTFLSTGAPAHTLLLVGAAGTGKTAVLEQARRGVAEQGARVLRLRCDDSAHPPGAAALADGIHQVLAKVHDRRSPARTGALRRIRLRNTGRDGELTLLATLGEVLADAARHLPFALVIDDVERLPSPTSAALGLLLRVFRPAGVPVVMAGRPAHPGDTGARQLGAAADRLLALPQLGPAGVEALVVRRLGRPVEPALVTAVVRALGPMAGIPEAVLSVLDAMAEHGDLLELDGHVCLTEPEQALRLTTDVARLGRLCWPAGPPDDAALDAAAAVARNLEHAEIRLDDLHRLKPGGPRRAGLVDRTLTPLVADGILTVDEDRRIAFAVPALAAALRALPTRHAVSSLHALITRSLTDRLGAETAGGGHPRLADHVAAAGAELDDGLAVDVLLAAARTDARSDWSRSVRAYSWALRRLAPHDHRTPDVLREWAELSLRHADHSGALALGAPLLALLNTPSSDQDSARVTGMEDRVGSAPVTGLQARHRSAPVTGGRDPEGPARDAGARAPGGLTCIAPGRDPQEPQHAPAHGQESLQHTADARRPEASALEYVAGVWALAALHEHRLPGDLGTWTPASRPGERAPALAGFLALGGAYGIGPVTCRPDAEVHRGPDADDRRPGSGPLPSAAELRLLAGAAGGRAGLPDVLPPGPDGARSLDRLRNATAHADLAGALAAVLGDRYTGAGESTAGRCHAMVRAYLDGDWDSALESARRIEARSRTRGTTAGPAQTARALAADIHCVRGELGHARAWLELIPGTVTHPLVGWARLGVRYWSGQVDEALDGALDEVRRARRSGLLSGLEKVLVRYLSFALLEAVPQAMEQALAELETLDEEVGSPMTREAVLLGRGLVRRDTDSALAALRAVRRRGDVYLELLCHLGLAEIGDDSERWLAEATRGARALGIGRATRTSLGHMTRRRTLVLPRARPAGDALSEEDVELTAMVSHGATNRQIAARLVWSEKTVERRLTRLFQRTGCRSRVELAAAWLDGSLVRRRLVPDGGRGAGRSFPAPGPGTPPGRR